ncbi:MAG: glyceraldehyde-3-phosphate dehydrogenase [Chitinophagales bacterium]|nr:glyceraldehyde-3-phosphate dehydrogenase [Chitinophagales bacterium]
MNTTNWVSNEKKAIQLLQIAGELWLEQNVELVIFRRTLVDSRTSEVLNNHEYASKYIKSPVTVDTTLCIAEAIAQLDLSPTRIDLGRLAKEWLEEKDNFNNDCLSFVKSKLSQSIGKEKRVLEPKPVVLFGFGRIGRLVARELISQQGIGEQLVLKAIVTRGNSDLEIQKRATLMRKDSVHGKFRGVIKEDYDNKALIINGNVVHMISANDPSAIDYTAYGIDNALLIDNSGIFRDEESLANHKKSKGISKVLLTAPGKGNLPNIVFGVNQDDFDLDKIDIYTAASCTTNAISTVIKVIDDAYGIESGHVETVHSYTNDQNLLDNFHKKYRRGRSAPMNMVITETGAASAVTKVLPSMAGKFTGNAVRVPTPDVSLAILHLKLNTAVDGIEAVNKVLEDAASIGNLVEQIDYSTSQEMVSSDCIGNPHASIVDAPATLVSPDNKSIVLYVWYDNEYGYTRQVVRLAKHICKVRRLTYY